MLIHLHEQIRILNYLKKNKRIIKLKKIPGKYRFSLLFLRIGHKSLER